MAANVEENIATTFTTTKQQLVFIEAISILSLPLQQRNVFCCSKRTLTMF